ncbi:MAG TPA: hypothetical protein DC049_00775 [Spirochaetia bacterium]|nr:hypothetical protein [Spirochaetia bacterium]
MSTIREAQKMLIKEDLIIKIQGKGTFIKNVVFKEKTR